MVIQICSNSKEEYAALVNTHNSLNIAWPETQRSTHAYAETDQKRGIGSALYEQVMEGLRPHHPRILRTDPFTNLPQGFRFLQNEALTKTFARRPSTRRLPHLTIVLTHHWKRN